MFEEFQSIVELEAQKDLDRKLAANGGTLSQDDKEDIVKQQLNRTDVSDEEVEQVMEDLAAKAAGDAARDCFNRARGNEARMAACRREAQKQMGKRLGRNVSDIEERELLKRDAARVADDKLEAESCAPQDGAQSARLAPNSGSRWRTSWPISASEGGQTAARSGAKRGSRSLWPLAPAPLE